MVMLYRGKIRQALDNQVLQLQFGVSKGTVINVFGMFAWSMPHVQILLFDFGQDETLLRSKRTSCMKNFPVCPRISVTFKANSGILWQVLKSGAFCS